MDREPGKRRKTWFTKPRPKTLGQTWQHGQQAEQKSDAWLTREGPPPQEQPSKRMDWQPLPPLPKWPPLPEESLLPQDHVRDGAPFRPLEAPTAAQPIVSWDLPTQGKDDLPEPPQHTLWLRFRSASRPAQVGIAAAIACTFVLCSLLGVAALSGTFQPSASHYGIIGGSTSLLGNGTASPSTTLTTPSTTVSPNAPTTTPVPPFAITFTCASGAIGAQGEVCVHTRPNAMLTVRVQYCDGSFAGGKSLQGIAHADGSGDYTWRWNVATTCAGTATATVTAKSGGESVTQSTTFTITN